MRVMLDSVVAEHLPFGADLYAAYVNGKYANVEAVRRRFPGKKIVTIAVTTAAVADVLDVEAGDARPEDAPRWVQQRRAEWRDPTVYCPLSLHPRVRAAFQKAGVAEPHYWIACYDGKATLGGMPAGTVAKQHGGDLPGNYDVSIVADYWPGVDPLPPEDALMADERIIIVPAPDAQGRQFVFDDHEGKQLGKWSATSTAVVCASHDAHVTRLLVQPCLVVDAPIPDLLCLVVASLDGSPAPVGAQARVLIEHR